MKPPPRSRQSSGCDSATRPPPGRVENGLSGSTIDLFDKVVARSRRTAGQFFDFYADQGGCATCWRRPAASACQIRQARSTIAWKR
jgi:hypothetical protein